MYKGNELNWTWEQIDHQFLVISQIRSGTQMLIYSLQSHPDVVIKSWSGLKGMKFEGLHEFEISPQAKEKKSRGTFIHQWCDFYIWENFDLKPERFWKIISNFFSHRVIIVKRINQLRRYLSSCLGFAGTFDVASPRKRDQQVYLDFDDFLATVKENEKTQTLLKKTFPHAIVLIYCDLHNQWNKTLCRIQKYLDIEVHPLALYTYRQETRPVSQIIGNWSSELERQLRKHGYGEWIDEPC